MATLFAVIIKPRVLRGLKHLPLEVRSGLIALEEVLRARGPTGPHEWKNFGMLRGKKDQRLYHCHLSKDHQYVACWEYHKKTILIEIFYAGPHPSGKYPTNRP